MTLLSWSQEFEEFLILKKFIFFSYFTFLPFQFSKLFLDCPLLPTKSNMGVFVFRSKDTSFINMTAGAAEDVRAISTIVVYK